MSAAEQVINVTFTNEELDAAKKKFPRGAHYEIGGHDFYLRPPSRDEYRRFQATASEAADRPVAMETLALECTVYPDRMGVTAILDLQPALISKLYATAMDLAGSESKVIKKG